MSGAALESQTHPEWRPATLHGGPASRLLGTAVLCATGVALAPAEGAVAVLALTMTLCCIFLFSDVARVPSHVWGPVLGALAVLALPHLAQAFDIESPAIGGADLADELVGHLAVPCLILVLAYLSISLDDSGFFDWCSLQIMRGAAGDGRRLLVYLFVGVSLLTFFTSNDIVILSVTPILIYLGRNAGITNLTPLLMTQYIAANTASMGLYIGNPTNIVIASAANLDFLTYAQRMAWPTVIATCTALAMVWLLFAQTRSRNRVPRSYRVPEQAARSTFTREMGFKATTFVLCLAALGAVSLWQPEDSGVAGGHEVPAMIAISLLFALALASYDCGRAKQARAVLLGQLRRLPFEIVPFFLSFCIILRGLEQAGVMGRAIETVVDAFAYGPIAGSLATGFYGVAAVNLTNNIPATILFEKMWLSDPAAASSLPGLGARLAELHPAYPDIFVDGALYASNFGANLTLIGALAGLMWFRLIRANLAEDGETRGPTVNELTIYGLMIVPVVTVVTCAAIGFLRMHSG